MPIQRAFSIFYALSCHMSTLQYIRWTSKLLLFKFVDLSELSSRSTGNFWRFLKLCFQTMLLRVKEGEFIHGLMSKIELFSNNIWRNLRLCETIWVFFRLNFVSKFVRTWLLKITQRTILLSQRCSLSFRSSGRFSSSALMDQWFWYIFLNSRISL